MSDGGTGASRHSHEGGARPREARPPASSTCTRRRFLELGALAGAAAATGLGCSPDQAREASTMPNRDVPGAGSSPNPDPDFPLAEHSIAQLQAALESGEHTARSLAEAYLERAARVDAGGPAVNALIETNPDALAIADHLDEERRQGHLRGPLHGIPVVVKDNIDTADRMETTAGSLSLVGAPPVRDSTVVRRLREAGAVLLAKTNLSEWANFRSTRSSSGWSARGGQTRNPYALDRNPCGSSSGSGVAASADLCAGAIGTETDGSVVCPSTVNGIVGLKPTVGLVSRAGIVPISHTQDTAGPMCRTVADAATLLGALAGVDDSDPATCASTGRFSGDYRQFLQTDGLRGARLGVVRGYFGFHDGVDALMEDSLAALREAGAELVDPVELATREQFGEFEWQVLLYEFKADLNAYLAARPGVQYRTLAELIDFNRAHAAREMPHFGQEIFELSQEKGPLTEEEYVDAVEASQRLAGEEGIDAALGEHRLDALVAPTGGLAWLTDWINGDSGKGGCSGPAAAAGYPHLTVPAGFVSGLPVGLSFFGAAWSEPTLIRLAYAFEQTVQARRPPGFAATAGETRRG